MTGRNKPPDEVLRDFTIWQQDTQDSIFQNAIFVAGISPVGIYTMFRQDFFEKHGRTEVVMLTLLKAREEIDKKIKELQQ